MSYVLDSPDRLDVAVENGRGERACASDNHLNAVRLTAVQRIRLAATEAD
jgi:hypothetical protein